MGGLWGDTEALFLAMQFSTRPTFITQHEAYGSFSIDTLYKLCQYHSMKNLHSLKILEDLGEGFSLRKDGRDWCVCWVGGGKHFLRVVFNSKPTEEEIAYAKMNIRGSWSARDHGIAAA